jgi:hypothetical protein
MNTRDDLDPLFDDLGRRLKAWMSTTAPRPDAVALVGGAVRRTESVGQRPRLLARNGLGRSGRPWIALGLAAALVLPAGWLAAGAPLPIPTVPSVVLQTSGPTSPLPPFAGARNGLIAYTVGNDLFAGDPATGASRKIAADVGQDALFSRDGDRIATVRLVKEGTGWCHSASPPGLLGPSAVPAANCTSQLVVTTAAGRSTVTPDALPYPARPLDWSADGRWILVQSGYEDTLDTLWAVAADGSGAHQVGSGPYAPAAFGPPDGQTVWSLGPGAGGTSIGLVTTDLQGGARSQIVPVPDMQGETFALSPDGTRVAVSQVGSITVLHTDGTPERTIPLGTSVTAVTRLAFSPNGRELLVEQDSAGVPWNVIVSVDGSTANALTFGVQAGGSRHGCSWSPDGTSLLCHDDEGIYWIVDRTGGPDRQLSWGDPGFGYLLSWQRVAPSSP